MTSPAISPYTFAATEGENGVVLTGYVPDDATRTALIAQAEATTDGTVIDRLELDRALRQVLLIWLALASPVWVSSRQARPL